jgi:hypothetical protein
VTCIDRQQAEAYVKWAGKRMPTWEEAYAIKHDGRIRLPKIQRYRRWLVIDFYISTPHPPGVCGGFRSSEFGILLAK